MIVSVTKILGKNMHTICFAHTINLISECVVKHLSIVSLIIKVRNIVLWVKRSVIVSDKMRKLQIESGVYVESIKKMILDVKTRWNSTYYMIEHYIEMMQITAAYFFTRHAHSH